MKKLLLIAISIIFCNYNLAQTKVTLSPKQIIRIPGEYKSKIGSGDLIKVVSEKLLSSKSLNTISQYQPVQVIIYQRSYPTNGQIAHLQNLGVKCYLDSWTPPFGDHPFGFFEAELPSNKLLDLLADENVRKVESAETLSIPQDNEAARKIKADLVWSEGITGGGVKLAILDSGIDTDPSNPDLSGSITKKDYSNYPALDDDVENRAISHGTQVVGAAFGNGFLSDNNVANGGGAYKGIASGASLVFLKIGNDVNGGAKTSAILNALDAAVNIYGAKAISLSYGSWDIYHDGSGTQDQKVDWCYSQGVPVFLAAGNDGNSKRHYSGTVNGSDSTGFIQILITNASANSTYLAFNLVWFDGLDVHKDLKLKYYNSSFQEISNTYNYVQTESNKGTESAISQMLSTVPAGNSVYYLRIINRSGSSQQYHIYEHYKDGKVTFGNPDPNYTLVSPATATYGFAVGSFTSRQSWTSYNGSTYSFGENVDQVSSFSSRGPRIDGLQKPDLVAPGSGIISMRDRNVQTTADANWIDNDGLSGGDANYYIVQGTSFAAPNAAGAAILLFNTFPNATASEILNALRNNTTVDGYTGSTPNPAYGYGKLNVYSATNDANLGNSYSVKLNAKVFLNGPYQNGSMNTLLLSNNMLPLTQPYNKSPWNYNGPESVISLPPNIVDWVLVEIRTTTDASSVLTRKAALLKNDGCIVDLNGSSMVSLPGVSPGNYYLVLKHRNHLAVMSSSTASLTTSSSLYDFTTSLASTYGTYAMKSLGNGKYGMWAGDASGDGTINSTDLNEYWMRENATSYDYSSKPADFNLDGNINATDLNLFWLLNNGISTKVSN